jgi:hypothetical protein
MTSTISRFGPPIALMALSWYLSAQPDLKSGLDSDLDLVLRKGAHITLFGLIMLAWWRAVGPAAAVVITLAYAGVDEWHQSFVEGRNGAVHDWAIDALGAGIASALMVWRLRHTTSTKADGYAGSATSGRSS